jgi:threonine synthase
MMGRCPNCDGIFSANYDEDAVSRLGNIQPGPGLDRFRVMMPTRAEIPFLGEGDTPLIKSRRLGKALGLSHLYFKNEGRNPSGAFKDRAGAMAAALALESGATGVVTASSGNAASAISAYCATAGLKCLILLEPGNPPNKLRQTLATGAQVLLVNGIFSHGPEALHSLLAEVAARLNYYLAFVWAPINPYLLEGIKTISYEIVAQLGDAPELVACPVGGGDLFAAQWRGYRELKRAGLITNLPRMIGVQSLSAPPLLEAFRNRAGRTTTLPYANSKISGINTAFTGDHALRAVYESEGAVAGVTDEEAFVMQARIGREEGLWVEPAAAAGAAALPKLLAEGAIRADARIVCLFSGAGFKDSHLAEAEARAINEQTPVGLQVEEIVRQVRFEVRRQRIPNG